MRGIEKRRGLCRPYRANRLTMIVDFFNSYPGLKPAVGRLSARAVTGRAFSPEDCVEPFHGFTTLLGFQSLRVFFTVPWFYESASRKIFRMAA